LAANCIKETASKSALTIHIQAKDYVFLALNHAKIAQTKILVLPALKHSYCTMENALIDAQISKPMLMENVFLVLINIAKNAVLLTQLIALFVAPIISYIKENALPDATKDSMNY
jgi:hypothetical protein